MKPCTLAFPRCRANKGAATRIRINDGKKIPTVETIPRSRPAYKCRGDDNQARADHADGDGDQKLPLIEPVVLVDQALLKKWNDDEAAAKRQ